MNGEPWGYSVCESLHLIPSESCCFELFCHMWETSKGPKGPHQHTPPSPCTGSCWLFWTVSLSFNNSCWGTLISQGPAVLKYSTIFPSSSKEWSVWKIPENTEVQSVRDTPLALRYILPQTHPPQQSLLAPPVCNLQSSSPHPLLRPFLIQGHLPDPALKCWNEKQNKWILKSRTEWEVGKSWFPVRENISSCCNWPTKGEEKVRSLRKTAEQELWDFRDSGLTRTRKTDLLQSIMQFKGKFLFIFYFLLPCTLQVSSTAEPINHCSWKKMETTTA